MSEPQKPQEPVAQKILRALQEFTDDLKNDVKITEKYRCRRIVRNEDGTHTIFEPKKEKR